MSILTKEVDFRLYSDENIAAGYFIRFFQARFESFALLPMIKLPNDQDSARHLVASAFVQLWKVHEPWVNDEGVFVYLNNFIRKETKILLRLKESNPRAIFRMDLRTIEWMPVDIRDRVINIVDRAKNQGRQLQAGPCVDDTADTSAAMRTTQVTS